MRRSLWSAAALVLGSLMFLLVRLMHTAEARSIDAVDAAPAPAFTHTAAEEWLNSAPLSWTDLRGQVVLLDVWTFECWNCYRSIPWVQSLEQRLGGKGFRVIGVHTPEFEREKLRGNVEHEARRLGFSYPIMLDNDYSYWNALDNHYWPAFYLVDRQGRLRGSYFGETHVGDPRARQIEQELARLLAE